MSKKRKRKTKNRKKYIFSLLLMLALGYWDEENSPMGLQILLQAQTQALLLLPLIAGMAVSRIRALCRRKEARHA